MVTALVTMLILITIAAGLTQARRMAHIEAHKRLMQTLAGETMESASAMLLNDIRTQLTASDFNSDRHCGAAELANGQLNSYLLSSTLQNNISLTVGSSTEGTDASPIYSLTLTSPLDDLNSRVVIDSSLTPSQLTGTQISIGPYDPYASVSSVNRSYLFTIRRANILRSGTFAWDNLDLIKQVDVVTRSIPVSAFTLYGYTNYGSVGSMNYQALVALSAQVIETSNGAGIGRIYWPGSILLPSNVDVLYPLLVGRYMGFVYPGCFVISGSGWSQNWWSNPANNTAIPLLNFYLSNMMKYEYGPNKYNLYQGKIRSLEDIYGPYQKDKLYQDTSTISSNMSDPTNIVAKIGLKANYTIQFSGTYFQSNPISNGPININAITVNPPLGASDINNLYNSNAISVSASTSGTSVVSRQLTIDTSKLPSNIGSILLNGTYSTDVGTTYSVLITGTALCPNTIISPHRVIILDSFNTYQMIGGNRTPVSNPPGAAIIAPAVYSALSTNSNENVSVNGIIVTSILNMNWIFQYNPSDGYMPSGTSLTGGLSVWQYGVGSNVGNPTTITPDLYYIVGSKVPPLIPAVVDIRVSWDTLENNSFKALP